MTPVGVRIAGAEAPTAVGSAVDDDVRLYLPDRDVSDPELSIVIPALNEQLTIADFVAWCHEGLPRRRPVTR